MLLLDSFLRFSCCMNKLWLLRGKISLVLLILVLLGWKLSSCLKVTVINDCLIQQIKQSHVKLLITVLAGFDMCSESDKNCLKMWKNV